MSATVSLSIRVEFKFQIMSRCCRGDLPKLQWLVLGLGVIMVSQKTFVAFASKDPLIVEVISEACEAVKAGASELIPWNRNDVSGKEIGSSVFTNIESADSFIADISEPNHNVTYEVGLAYGLKKPCRLVRSTSKPIKPIEDIGLLHNIGHDEYSTRVILTQLLSKRPATALWKEARRNKDQPIYYLQSATIDDVLRKLTSGIKKTIKLKYRTFSPREIDRLTATEAFEQVSQSFGVVATWVSGEAASSSAYKHNQRTAFSIGVARGLEIPYLLLAHRDERLPLDLDELATRWSDIGDIDKILREFRDDVAEAQEQYVETRPSAGRYLDLVHCGDPAAENEASQLDGYFLETEQFRLTLRGELNILLGRKGSGKTAIFLQVRDRVRSDKSNIVVDLQPEGFQLIRLKEFIRNRLGHGARKEFIAAFWEYIVWLEIAYKILEKDAKRVQHDPQLYDRYERLKIAYDTRVEGSGDFSERLTGLPTSPRFE